MKEVIEEYGAAILAAIGSMTGFAILGKILYEPGSLMAAYVAAWMEQL